MRAITITCMTDVARGETSRLELALQHLDIRVGHRLELAVVRIKVPADEVNVDEILPSLARQLE